MHADALLARGNAALLARQQRQPHSRYLEIARRLRTAELELREAPKFDFRIESRSREEDFAALLAIIDRVRPTRT